MSKCSVSRQLLQNQMFFTLCPACGQHQLREYASCGWVVFDHPNSSRYITVLTHQCYIYTYHGSHQVYKFKFITKFIQQLQILNQKSSRSCKQLISIYDLNFSIYVLMYNPKPQNVILSMKVLSEWMYVCYCCKNQCWEVLWYKAVSLVGSRSGSRVPELDAQNFAKTRMGSKVCKCLFVETRTTTTTTRMLIPFSAGPGSLAKGVKLL